MILSKQPFEVTSQVTIAGPKIAADIFIDLAKKRVRDALRGRSGQVRGRFELQPWCAASCPALPGITLRAFPVIVLQPWCNLVKAAV